MNKKMITTIFSLLVVAFGISLTGCKPEPFKAGIFDRNGNEVSASEWDRLDGDTSKLKSKSIKLTLDMDLQKIAEEELNQGIEDFQAESATAIAVNPKTGEVLAMVTVGSNNNHAISYLHEPGATMKPIIAAIAMKEKLISENDIFQTEDGIFMVFDRIIRDIHTEKGPLTLSKALEVSSNIVFAQLGNTILDSIGSSKYLKYINDFGFGFKTGIDLTGENAGKLPGQKEFNRVTAAYVGHGYGLLITPLQLIMAYSAIANDGKLMKPYLVKEIRSIDGKANKKIEPEIVRKVISAENSGLLRKMLTGVVENGTAKAAQIENLDIAGKTGTTKKMNMGNYKGNNYIASFIGMYPADNPEVVMLILVDNPQKNYYGGPVAGSIFKNITLKWMKK